MCNYTTFAIQTEAGGAINTVIARPKSADSCRGDAPEAAFFDEIGFMSESMWYSFAFPLLQVSLVHAQNPLAVLHVYIQQQHLRDPGRIGR